MQTAKHRIDLHQFSLDVDADGLAALERHLTPDERDRARRFVVPKDGADFTVGRGRVREILADYVGRPAADLRFAYGAHGKPRLELDGSAPHFNLSHAGHRAALVVSPSVAVGVDIEVVRPIERGLARRFFAPGEVTALEALPPERWLDGFFQCWTRKEAVLKAMGRGFSMSLASFDVSIAADLPPRVMRLDEPGDAAQHWALFEVRPTPETIIAIAAAIDRSSVELIEGDAAESERRAAAHRSGA